MPDPHTPPNTEAATEGPDAALALPSATAAPMAVPPDPWQALRAHTPARIALGRSGASLPTQAWLDFAAAHALARDAVHVPLDVAALRSQLTADGWALLPTLHSRAPDRARYLRRPDLGRRLDEASAALLRDAASHSAGQPAPELAIVLGDGLSAVAVQRHAAPLLAALRMALAGADGAPTLRLAPLLIVEQARVALADEVGELLRAQLVLMLLGERPGLSAPDSLGAYLTHAPAVGCTDAQRNCVSNVRPEGLNIPQAAQRMAWLVREALRRRVTGIALKDDSGTPRLPPDAGLASDAA